MSLDHSVYVGPFALCRVRRVPGTRSLPSCPTPSCAQHGRLLEMSYCGRCGGKCSMVDSACERDSVDVDDAARAVKYALFEVSGRLGAEAPVIGGAGAHVWLPSRIGPRPQREGRRVGLLESGTRTACCEVTPADVAAETLAFGQDYGMELGALEALYGEGAVARTWGVLVYSW
jgi:hypothetical protein